MYVSVHLDRRRDDCPIFTYINDTYEGILSTPLSFDLVNWREVLLWNTHPNCNIVMVHFTIHKLILESIVWTAVIVDSGVDAAAYFSGQFYAVTKYNAFLHLSKTIRQRN